LKEKQKGNKRETKSDKGQQRETEGKQQGDKGKQRETKGKQKETKVNTRLKVSYLCSRFRKGGQPRWGPGCGPGAGKQNGELGMAGWPSWTMRGLARKAEQGSAILGSIGFGFLISGPRKRDRFWGQIPTPKMVSPFSKS
jgi:hypothetical protein